MALACVFLGSMILIRFEQDAPGELVDCAEVFGLVERVKATLDDLSSTQRQVMRGAGLYDAVKVMREVVELCISEPEFNEELIAERMLETSIHSLLTVLGFQPDDRWTVCIFKAEIAKGKPVTLSVLAHRRYEPCDRGKTRVWQSGEGNVGLAFLKKEELIIENSSTPDVANTYRPSQDNRRAHDANLYASSVTVPVLVGKDDRAWGVVVATSSKHGHFRHGDRSQLHPAEAMRVLGSMLELAVTRTYK